MDEFTGLTEDKQKSLDEQFAGFQRIIARQILIPVIRDTQRRFEQDIYPQVLTQMSAWTHTARTAEPETPYQEPPVEYISSQSMRVNFKQAYLATEADVDRYLAQLKTTMLEAIRSGKRIQI